MKRTSSLVLPELPERICDLVARMRDETQGGLPCAGIVEFQLTPDALMTGRLLVAGGMLWLRWKPTAHRGDRFGLVGVVVNLTGVGDCSHSTAVGTAEWTLRPREVNLSRLDAERVMDDAEAGEVPPEVLAFVPLMKNGGEPDTMARWYGTVNALGDLATRGDCALAVVYAGAVGLRDEWEKLVENLSMIESPVVADWMRKSEDKGHAKGVIKGKIEALLRILGRKGAIPGDLRNLIHACEDNARMDSWTEAALDATSIDDFRTRAGI